MPLARLTVQLVGVSTAPHMKSQLTSVVKIEILEDTDLKIPVLRYRKSTVSYDVCNGIDTDDYERRNTGS